MRYAVIIFIFSFSLLFGASSEKVEAKIIMSMLKAVTNHTDLSIYTDSKNINKILLNNDITFVKSCYKADIAILETDMSVTECKNRPIITLRYDLLKIYSNSIGSFFWQKGRPNIVFIETRLRDQNITIDSTFNDFIEDTIW